jgi:ketosteroid isomerase-like protein
MEESMKNILVVLLLITGAAGAAAAQCADAGALEAFDHAWGTASTSGDRAALMNIYADDYMGLPGMQNKAAAIDNAVKAAERNKANPSGDKVTYDHYFISCTPNTATITHRNTIWTPMGAGGKPETFYTRSVHFLEKRGGKWMVVSNAGGGDLDDYGQLWYLEQDWNDAVLKQDKSWFEKNYADDFTSISGSSGTLMNKAEDIADTIDPKTKFDAVDTSDMNIRVDGDKAIVTGVFHTKGTGASGPFDRKVRYTDVWIKRDGRWMAWSSQGTILK